MVLLGHRLLFLSVYFISGMIATKYLVLSSLVNRKLMSPETVSGITFFHEYNVIEISKFCSQTRSVRNRRKFPAAKWTDLAL